MSVYGARVVEEIRTHFTISSESLSFLQQNFISVCYLQDMTEDNIKKTYVYIDGANLDKGTSKYGWKIDYGRFYVWLKDKYAIDEAYIFIGYVSIYENLYKKMRLAGFNIIFKTTTFDRITNTMKGNCDADLVLKTVVDVYENKSSNVIIVSSDGDFASLASFLQKKGIEQCIISPSDNCSILLIQINVPILYLNEFRNHLSLERSIINKKAPDEDKTS